MPSTASETYSSNTATLPHHKSNRLSYRLGKFVPIPGERFWSTQLSSFGPERGQRRSGQGRDDRELVALTRKANVTAISMTDVHVLRRRAADLDRVSKAF